jgi:hypothetical protein
LKLPGSNGDFAGGELLNQHHRLNDSIKPKAAAPPVEMMGTIVPSIQYLVTDMGRIHLLEMQRMPNKMETRSYNTTYAMQAEC